MDAMSFFGGSENPEMDEYLENMPSEWPRTGATPYNYSYCTAAFSAPGLLTPISLPGSSFGDTRLSPVLSHHSQEYQYGVGEAALPQSGLGLSGPFPSNYPMAATAGLELAPANVFYDTRETTHSPQRQPARRTRRSARSTPPIRETPVLIRPHPEGLQRLEEERRQYDLEQQRARASGRRRRDPQAEEENAFVESLRDQGMSWKTIRERYRERFNKDAAEASLQMRMTRRRKERQARWDEDDVSTCPLLLSTSSDVGS